MKENTDHAGEMTATTTGLFFMAGPSAVLLLLAGHLAEGALLLVVVLVCGAHLARKGKLGTWRAYLL